MLLFVSLFRLYVCCFFFLEKKSTKFGGRQGGGDLGGVGKGK